MGTLSGDLVLNAPTTHIVASDSLQIDDMRIAGDEIFALSDSDIEIMVRPLSTAILCCHQTLDRHYFMLATLTDPYHNLSLARALSLTASSWYQGRV